MIERILILEDDTMARQAITDYLSEHGWQVQSAANVQKAMQLAGEAEPDLAVCDWELGETATGIDAARRLQKQFGTKIILVSGRSLHALKTSSSDINVVRYLEKPFSLKALRQAIQSADT